MKCHRLAGKAVLNVGMFYSLVSSLFVVDVEKPRQMEIEGRWKGHRLREGKRGGERRGRGKKQGEGVREKTDPERHRGGKKDQRERR